MRTLNLADMRRDPPAQRTPAELIELARNAPQGARPKLSIGVAREHAVDCITDFVRSLMELVVARKIVDADERLQHLTDEERQLVADLIDEAKATIDCEFNAKEGEGG